ncbi:hypothetical protein Cgig2_001357 [Carnegiea gigantea]|uniref:Uncharacterized protein n=1 Tax=Carnegiea gigantea TaxID=171969 RepID=A0A9Q1QQ82_9CARY|nr:hypothetical protein Cgig2_001357 [Carnegiea gigantea]
MAKWLRIYSAVLLVRVLPSWFPNIHWDRQPLSALRDMCDSYLGLFRNIIPPLFKTLHVCSERIELESAWASWALDIGLKPRKAQKNAGFKNELSLTHSKAQMSGLRAFVSLGARFFKHKHRDTNNLTVSLENFLNDSFPKVASEQGLGHRSHAFHKMNLIETSTYYHAYSNSKLKRNKSYLRKPHEATRRVDKVHGIAGKKPFIERARNSIHKAMPKVLFIISHYLLLKLLKLC